MILYLLVSWLQWGSQQFQPLVHDLWRVSGQTTRLILNTTGSAFQKLQLHQAELLTGEESAIKKLIELLGGQWGRVPLAKKYEEAEIALFHTQQHGDETNDSYLARADVNWSKLLAQKTTLADLQAFITLRGSSLTAEDKKKDHPGVRDRGPVNYQTCCRINQNAGVGVFP